MPGGSDRTVTVTLSARISQFVAAMASAGAEVKALGTEMDKATSTEKGRANLDKMAGTMAGFGAVLVGVAAGAVALSAQFDAAMSKVKSNIDDKSAPAMKKLSDAAIQAGKDTQYSATEAANAEDELAKAGISAKDIYGGALTGALSLAAAGQLDVGDAAEIAASAMNNFHLAGTQIPHVADLLAAGADKAQGSVQDLGEALKYVGPVAGQMGISIESTVGVLTELASQGIMGSQAGTSLRGVLSSLTSPSIQASQVMKSLGIELYDAQGKFVGLAGMAGQLHDKLKGLTEAQRDQALGQIFGNQQITAARVLYDQGAAGVDKFTKEVDDQGFAAQSAATKMDNLQGDLKKLQSSLETDLIQAGSGANNSLRGLAQGATSVVNAFGSLPKGLQSATVYIAAAVGGLALLGAGFVKARTGIGALKDQLTSLGPAGEKAATGLGKVTSVAGKIGGIATVVYLGGLALSAAGNAISDAMTKAEPSVSALERSLLKLASTGKLSGAALDVMGPHAKQLAQDIDLTSASASALTKSLKFVSDANEKVAATFGYHGEIYGPFDDAEKHVKSLDSALTDLVKNGHADQVQQALVNMSIKSGVGIDQLLKQFPSLSGALDDVASSASQSSGPMAGLVTSFDGNALSAQAAADAVDNFVSALHAADDPALGEFQATTAFQGSLLGLKQELGDTGFSLDATSTKGQAFRDAVAKAAQSALDLTDSEAKLHVGTDAASQAITASRNSLIAILTPYFNSKAAAQAFVDTVLKIPPSKATNVSVPGAKTSADAVWNLKNALDSLKNKNVTVTEYLNTVYSSSGSPAGAQKNPTTKGGLPGLLDPNGGWLGTIHHAAAGGVFDAGIYSHGPILFAEESTGGEGFVPRYGQTARSRQIIDTEAGWYGGTVMWSTGSAVPYGPVGGGSGGGSAAGSGSVGQQVAAGLAPLLMAMVRGIEAGRTISVQVGQQELVRAYDEGKRVTTWVG